MITMKFKPPVSMDAALRIFYTYPEIGNKEMKELFGGISGSTAVRYKAAVREQQVKDNVLTANIDTVNTAVAFKVWGIDVVDLERRRKKLKELGFTA